MNQEALVMVNSIVTGLAQGGVLGVCLVAAYYFIMQREKAMSEERKSWADNLNKNNEELRKVVVANTEAMTSSSEVMRQLSEEIHRNACRATAGAR